jgi:putative FmdB family regulatory protein
MPIHDFRCNSCNHVHEELVKWDVETHTCRKCGNESKRVFLKLAKPNWLAMGAQASVSPEFTDRFDKMHRKQAEKERKFEKEHGEGQYFNRQPGS